MSPHNACVMTVETILKKGKFYIPHTFGGKGEAGAVIFGGRGRLEH